MMFWSEGMLRIDGETTKVARGVVGARCPARVRVGRPIAHVAKGPRDHTGGLRKRVRQAEADNATRPDLPTTAERDEIRKLRRENPDSGSSGVDQSLRRTRAAQCRWLAALC